MKYCTECGKEINVADKFCSLCGSPVANKDKFNKSDAGKPTKAKVFNSLTESNENSEMHIDKDDAPFNLKDASKTNELERHIEFEIPQFIWLIILVAFTLLIASQNQYNFGYTLGNIFGMVIMDGLFIAVPIGIFMVASGLEKYHWYHWLNMLAYATVFARLFFGFLNTL